MGIIQRIQFRNETHECSIPTAKVGSDPDLIADEPPLSHEDQSLSHFPSWEGEGPERCVRGLLRAFWPKQTRAFELRYKREIFWLVFREAHPQIAFAAFRPLRNLSSAKVAPQKLTLELFLWRKLRFATTSRKLLVHFFWQGLSQDFEPIIDQRHPD